MVRLRKWSEAEGKLTVLLDSAEQSHTTIRRELLSGLGRAQFHLKRDIALALETLEVCGVCICCDGTELHSNELLWQNLSHVFLLMLVL